MSHHEFPAIAVRLDACYWAVYGPDAPDERPCALFIEIDDAMTYGRGLSEPGVRISPLWLRDASLFRNCEEEDSASGDSPPPSASS